MGLIMTGALGDSTVRSLIIVRTTLWPSSTLAPSFRILTLAVIVLTRVRIVVGGRVLICAMFMAPRVAI